MFGMFPFMFNNSPMNNNNNNNFNYGSILNGLLNDDFINGMVDQLLSSDFVNNMVDDLMNEDAYDISIDDLMNEDAYDISIKDYGPYYLIKGYLPGLTPKDVNIDFEKNKAILTIKKKQTYSNGKNVRMTIIQTGGDLVKTFYVEEIDVTKLKASFDNELLLLTLPKRKQIQSKDVVVEDDSPTIIDVDNYKVE